MVAIGRVGAFHHAQHHTCKGSICVWKMPERNFLAKVVTIIVTHFIRSCDMQSVPNLTLTPSTRLVLLGANYMDDDNLLDANDLVDDNLLDANDMGDDNLTLCVRF